MILGALLDAGLPFADLRRALGSLAIDPATVWTERVTRAGVSATKFHVAGEAVGHAHDHAHEGNSRTETPPLDHDREHARQPHPHRSLAEIYALIDRSALSPQG